MPIVPAGTHRHIITTVALIGIGREHRTLHDTNLTSIASSTFSKYLFVIKKMRDIKIKVNKIYLFRVKKEESRIF